MKYTIWPWTVDITFIVDNPRLIALSLSPMIILIYKDIPLIKNCVCDMISCKAFRWYKSNVLKWLMNNSCLRGYLCHLTHGWWVESNRSVIICGLPTMLMAEKREHLWQSLFSCLFFNLAFPPKITEETNPTLYWYQNQKFPCKQRYIVGSAKCFMKSLSKMITFILSTVKSDCHS